MTKSKPKPPYTGLTSKYVVVKQTVHYYDEFNRGYRTIKAKTRVNRLRLKAALGNSHFHALAAAGQIVEVKEHKR